MKRLLLLAFWFIISISGCQTDGDPHKSASLLPPTEKIISDATSAMEEQKPQEAENPSGPSVLSNALELQSGTYGIPFGATTEELMKWCTDNHMAISNPTEKQVKEYTPTHCQDRKLCFLR